MTTQIPAINGHCADAPVLDPEARLRTEREQLTHLLRALAADVDELDRRLARITRPPITGPSITSRLRAEAPQATRDGVDRELTMLAIQRDRLAGRLQGLAARLKDIDAALSGASSDRWPSVHVGTCPDCGYPSLGSGLCATCRLYLVR